METKKHTLQELLGEIKLVDKRINKEEEDFDKAVITDKERPVFGYDDGDKKFKLDKAKNYMKGKYDAYTSLVERLAFLRELRDKTNMDTPIAIDGKSFTIYTAIMFKNVMAKKLGLMYNRILQSAANAEQQAERNTIRGVMESAKQNAPIELSQLLDIEKMKKEAIRHEKLVQHLDDALTVANSVTEVEY